MKFKGILEDTRKEFGQLCADFGTLKNFSFYLPHKELSNRVNGQFFLKFSNALYITNQSSVGRGRVLKSKHFIFGPPGPQLGVFMQLDYLYIFCEKRNLEKSCVLCSAPSGLHYTCQKELAGLKQINILQRKMNLQIKEF